MMKWLLMILAMFSNENRTSTVGNTKVWAVNKESKISILGSSNVTTFTFNAKNYSGNDTLLPSLHDKYTLVFFRKGILRFPVVDFRNPNPILSKDFKRIIKAKFYPEIVMDFRFLNTVPETGMKNERACTEVKISLAGKSKVFRFFVLASRHGETIRLQGKERICFSDFGLTAPDKVMGYISVKDELTVCFDLTLNVIKEG